MPDIPHSCCASALKQAMQEPCQPYLQLHMTLPGTCDTRNIGCACAVQYTREMDMMSHLPDHPNILKLLGACTTPDKLILVMQHCSR